MKLSRSIHIDAAPETVWRVLADVERWPEWTASMTEVKRLDSSGFGVGSRVRIKQPKLPPTVWRVTSFEPGRSFDWVASSPGAKTVARHVIETRDGGSTVTLTLEQTGLLGSFIGMLLSRLSRRYVEMEAAGLKQRSEALPLQFGHDSPRTPA
jgi:uncharacterized protein YndB with AHSA1/START domain